MRIKVIFTGGTISSDISENGIAVDKDNRVNKQLISNYLSENDDVIFDVSQPVIVLSENMGIDDLNKIIQELKSTDFSLYDGVIITHGTDTLAYTTNIMSILLAGIDIPVVFVSSNFILSDENSNGNDNFRGAVNFIKEKKYCGVFSVYKNCEGRVIVYLGSRLRQCESLTNKYSSTTDIDFGEMVDGRFVPVQSEINPTVGDFISNRQSEMLINHFKGLMQCVLFIQPYMAIDYECFQPTKNIKAVLHSLYHAGTACTKGNSDILTFSKSCREKGIDFYISPLESRLKDNYETTKQMLEAGIIPMYDISTEMSYTKLLLAYSTDDKDLRNYILNTNIFFEKSL